jgi:hypothetical protein
MQASQGIVAAARLAQAPIIPISYATRRHRVMRSWDRFHLAFPFTSGIHLWGTPIEVPADADEATLERYRVEVEAQLNALGREADRRMGHDLPPLPHAGKDEDAESALQYRAPDLSELLAPHDRATSPRSWSRINAS